MCMNDKKAGRPRKEPTSTINFRLPKTDIKQLHIHYPDLSKLFRAWVQTLKTWE